MTIEEFFGTLQESVVTTWRKHLKTKEKTIRTMEKCGNITEM